LAGEWFVTIPAENFGWFAVQGQCRLSVRTEIIENDARTSRISGFGLGGRKPREKILLQPSLETQALLCRRGNSNAQARFSIISVFAVYASHVKTYTIILVFGEPDRYLMKPKTHARGLACLDQEVGRGLFTSSPLGYHMFGQDIKLWLNFQHTILLNKLQTHFYHLLPSIPLPAECAETEMCCWWEMAAVRIRDPSWIRRFTLLLLPYHLHRLPAVLGGKEGRN